MALDVTKRQIWVTFPKKVYICIRRQKMIRSVVTGDEYDVSFLGYAHRHIFHFKVAIDVFHDDRDIEFIGSKRWLESLYASGTLELNPEVVK